MEKRKTFISIVMGSESDREVMQPAADQLRNFNIAHEWVVISAHRAPEFLKEYLQGAESRGLSAVIAGAGGAAHLPGVVASYTTLPVLGVPIHTTHLNGLDSLLSIVQMPKGIPVATFALGKAGAANAAIFAAQMMAQGDEILREKVDGHRRSMKEELVAKSHESMVRFDG